MTLPVTVNTAQSELAQQPVLEAILHSQIESFPADLRLVGSLADIQETARALLAQGVQPRTSTPRSTKSSTRPSLTLLPTPDETPTAEPADLIGLLQPALHLLFVGPTRSGKSSIVHELA
jgi:hypothetical protein